MLLQASFDDLGTPLSEVTFCVVDLETTGGSPSEDGITELGAAKVRCGRLEGTFHSLVNPAMPIPAYIQLLTGISSAMVAQAPPISSLLGSFLEFSKNTVLVAHNARFDVAFLNRALLCGGYEELPNRVVDTALLARKVLAGEVRNSKLSTLAQHLRCLHHPCHRAFQDVLATVDVLHHLIERLAGFGVTTLEDLLAVSRARLDGTFAKITLTSGAPNKGGVYRFLGHDDRVLYVGKATDIRSRIRSYFYGDRRRGIADMLRQVQRIEWDVHPTMLQAEVAEARAIARLKPPFNRAGKTSGDWYLKVIAEGVRPRLAAARAIKGDGALYIGPIGSMRATKELIDALRDALPLARCTDPRRCGDCAFAQMRRCPGRDLHAQRRAVLQAARCLTVDPGPVVTRLEERMRMLAAGERYEEAAEVRDRGVAVERTAWRTARVASLVSAGRVVLRAEGTSLTISEGVLKTEDASLPSAPSHTERCREAAVIVSWLERNAARVELLDSERPWAMPARVRPPVTFKPSRDRR